MKDTHPATVAPSRETVSACIARLGPPPDDLWQQWLVEARRSIDQPDSWSPDADDPVWDQWFVDEHGNLVPSPSVLADRAKEHPTNEPMRVPATTPNEPNRATEWDANPSIAEPNSNDLDPPPNVLETEQKAGNRVEAKPKTNQPRAAKWKVIAATLTAIAAGLAVWMLLPLGSKTRPPTMPASRSLGAVSQTDLNASSPSSSLSPGRTASKTDFLSADRIDAGQTDDELQTIMSEVPDDADSIDNQLRSSGLSLDAFLPPEMLNTASPTKLADSSNSDPTDSNAPGNATLSIQEISVPKSPADEASLNTDESLMAADLFADDPDAGIEEENKLEEKPDADADEQSTIARDPIAAKTFGVLLPPVPSRAETPLPEPIELIRRDEISGGTLPGELTLSFPLGANGSAIMDSIRLDANDSPSSWSLIETESSATVAHIAASDDQSSLQFEWSDAARQWSSSASLSQGRITTNQGDTIFLRPRLDAEPIRLGLAKRDVKLKWNLQSPITPNLTQLELDVVVPRDVDLRWIEPIDQASPRNTRAVALLKLKKAEETAIVVRFDIKTSQSFSLRTRFGARLHPAMPWQWTDAPSIRSSLAAVTNQLEVADRQLLDLDVAITRAERMRARRQEYQLEEQRDRIDEAVKGWTIVAKRLAELDQLVAFMEAGAAVRPKLFVTWPDEEQVVFGIAD